MDRLIDYFAVVGYDFDAEDKDPALRGKVLFRAPEDDIKEVPFISGIELFCQPGGWHLAKEKQQPTFFVAFLTDAEGNRQFCAVHTFHEPLRPNSPTDTVRQYHTARSSSVISLRRAKSENDIIETGGVISFDGVVGDELIDEDMCRVEGGDSDAFKSIDNDETSRNLKYSYAPKSLVLLSRVHDFRILKNCLGLIYTVYIENLSQSIENILAKLLLVKAPPPGSTVVRFTIGAADKQALQTPQSNQLPVTRSSVTVLLRQLGILNVLNILSAALIDQKILFYSCSYARLTEACNALTALMYPFKYSYPFIPILPRHLLECTSSPTPFLFGVHSSFKHELQDLLDVITVDLDGGVISVPECVTIPSIPEPYYTSAVEALTKVLCPDLVVADWAYPPEQIRISEPDRLDKEIRAIFLRLFSQILMGYRSCLQVCRIHPDPIIRFQKDHYLHMRDFNASNTSLSNQFVPKLLESQAFSLFVQENGPPFRRLHIFDEVVSEIPDRIQADLHNVLFALKHVKLIASDLYVNENPNHLPLTERIPKPSEGSFTRSNQKKFPTLSVDAVNMFMEENRSKADRERTPKITKQLRKRVPKGNTPSSFTNRLAGAAASSRRLEVLKNCLSFIFESKTLEIKKIFQAVMRAMRSRGVRSALVQQLHPYSKSHAFLDNQQFDYISRLLNRALMDSSGQLDEYTLAADLLPIVTSFCRKLTSTVTQFLYTVVQEHPVWSSSNFWESAFFDDIQMEIQHLYRDCLKQERETVKKRRLQVTRSIPSSLKSLEADSLIDTSLADMEANPHWRDNKLCMDIAAIQLRMWYDWDDREQEEVSSAEESVVFSQAMLIAQKMVFILVPLDFSRVNRSKFLRPAPGEDHSSNSYVASSIHGSASDFIDDDHDFIDDPEMNNDISASVTKFICKFVDRVCTEACINNNHTKALLEKIEQLVFMQVETLIDVCRESKRIAPVTKPKLLHPQLLTGESMALEKPYRAFLTYDGRATATGGDIGGPVLLPAEGALFVTTYRVIFIGIPRDALASEQVVIRSFPVSSLFKAKTINTHDYPQIMEISKNLQHGIQLFSSSFQLLLLAFDEEVTAEEMEQLQKELHGLRYPDTIEGAFALSSALYSTSANATNTVIRSRSAAAWDNKTLTNTRATTLFLQAKRKVGLDKNSKKPLYSSSFAGVTAGNTLKPLAAPQAPLTVVHEENQKTAGNLSYEADFTRLDMIGFSEAKYRLTRLNQVFGVCKSYPSATIVPMSTTDDQIRALSQCHQNGRYPVVVWSHPSNSSMLLRSSGFRSRAIASLFKYGPTRLPEDSGSGFTKWAEKFLLLVASMTGTSSRPTSPVYRFDSVSSHNSVEDENQTQLSRGGFISSSIRMNRVRKWTTFSRPNGKVPNELPSPDKPGPIRTISAASAGSGNLAQVAIHHAMSQRASLYVFVDKDQFKNLKTDPHGRVTFVPLEYSGPKDIRTSFKSLLKSCLPVEAPPPPPSDTSAQQPTKENVAPYLKDVQESAWMEQVSLLLETSGCIVDVIDVHGGSVMLAIEDGMDAVPLLTSLSQLLLDPYYRTIEGFQVLVEKEWLSFGHRFGHRNRFNDIQSSGFTPVFLMFLDAVYQVHRQFPLSFEFNEFYLELLAYHYMSNRFTTFLLDCDYERLEAGILMGEYSDSSEGSNSQLKSFWGYVDAAHKRSPMFYNPLFSPQLLTTKVLRPVSSVYALKVWPYYVREALGEGPPYDGLLGELTAGSSHNEQEATETSEAWGGATGRRLVNRCYDNIADAQPDYIKILLNKIKGLQKDLGVEADEWSTVLGSAVDTTPSHAVQMPDTLKVRNDVLTLHKQSTVDFLTKRQPTIKRARSRRNSEKSMLQEEVVKMNGSRRNSLEDRSGSMSSLEGDTCLFTTKTDEVRTYEGALWKQGALIKGWKLRFFVLDTTKHELRQHDNEGSNLSKTIIDLKDLESVKKLDTLSGLPKEASDKACFEVKTSRRLYNFIAQNEQEATEWVDQLAATLQ